MKYHICITTTGDTIHADIECATIADAYTIAAALAPDDAITTRAYHHTDTLDGAMRGAMRVVYSHLDGIARQDSYDGTGGQGNMYRQSKSLRAACYVDGLAPSQLLDITSRYGDDLQDLMQDAHTAMWSAIAAYPDSVAAQYAAVNRAVGHALRALRTVRRMEVLAEYIKDAQGRERQVDKAYTAILDGNGHGYSPAGSDTLDRETARKGVITMAGIKALLSPMQCEILDLMVQGYNQHMIAREKKRSVSTIAEHIAKIRGKVADLLLEQAPDFVYHDSAISGQVEAYREAYQTAQRNGADTVKIEAVKAAKSLDRGNTEKRRTAQGAARHKAAHNAEYYREYRARKAAERAKLDNAN